MNNDHHPELQEVVEFKQPPKKAIVEIIDVDLDVPVLDEPNVDAEVPVQDATMNDEIGRILIQRTIMKNQNAQIMNYHSGLFDFETASKLKVIQLNVQGCIDIYGQLKNGFIQGNGVLHLPTRSGTEQMSSWVF